MKRQLRRQESTGWHRVGVRVVPLLLWLASQIYRNAVLRSGAG
jgi:hypothetical protein